MARIRGEGVAGQELKAELGRVLVQPIENRAGLNIDRRSDIVPRAPGGAASPPAAPGW